MPLFPGDLLRFTTYIYRYPTLLGVTISRYDLFVTVPCCCVTYITFPFPTLLTTTFVVVTWILLRFTLRLFLHLGVTVTDLPRCFHYHIYVGHPRLFVRRVTVVVRTVCCCPFPRFAYAFTFSLHHPLHTFVGDYLLRYGDCSVLIYILWVFVVPVTLFVVLISIYHVTFYPVGM